MDEDITIDDVKGLISNRGSGVHIYMPPGLIRELRAGYSAKKVDAWLRQFARTITAQLAASLDVDEINTIGYILFAQTVAGDVATTTDIAEAMNLSRQEVDARMMRLMEVGVIASAPIVGGTNHKN